jgi:hypothetical protein
MAKKGFNTSDFHSVFTDHKVKTQRQICNESGWRNIPSVKALFGASSHPDPVSQGKRPGLDFRFAVLFLCVFFIFINICHFTLSVHWSHPNFDDATHAISMDNSRNNSTAATKQNLTVSFGSQNKTNVVTLSPVPLPVAATKKDEMENTEGNITEPVASQTNATLSPVPRPNLEDETGFVEGDEENVASSFGNRTNVSLSLAQRRWRNFQIETGRTVVYVTGRFSRDIGKWESKVSSFKKIVLDSGLPDSQMHAYADTFPDFILEDTRWTHHLEFLKKKRSHTARGAGYWFWKPALVKHHMSTLREGDFLIYSDADNAEHGDLRYTEDLIRTMVDRGHNVAAWRYEDTRTPKKHCCPETHWNKRDTYEFYCPRRNQTSDLTGMYHAAWFMLEKTQATVDFIEDYLEGVSNIHLISDEPSQLPNGPYFIENRHDQSIFSLLMKCWYNETGIEKFKPTSKLRNSPRRKTYMLSISPRART